MPEVDQTDWTRHRVGALGGNPRWIEPNCCPLTSIFHVTHIHNSYRILEDRKISKQLIYDKSRLNRSRITVVWLSPNNWDGAGGSRYGNVQFQLDWNKVIENKKYFWIGVMDDYDPPACRILITNNDYSSKLKEYDPTLGDGPWWSIPSTGQHFWNGKICLEIMFEEDVMFENIQNISFVKHHPQRCCIDPTACPDRGLTSDDAASVFLQDIIGQSLFASVKQFWNSNSSRSDLSPLRQGWSELIDKIRNENFCFGGLVSRSSSIGAPLVRAFFNVYCRNIQAEARELIGQFVSFQEFGNCLATVIESELGLPGHVNRNGI